MHFHAIPIPVLAPVHVSMPVAVDLRRSARVCTGEQRSPLLYPFVDAGNGPAFDLNLGDGVEGFSYNSAGVFAFFGGFGVFLFKGFFGYRKKKSSS